MNRHRGLVCAMIALFGQALASTLPLFFAGWVECHDALRYLALHDQFRECVAHGIAYPRWLPYLYGGYGYPTFVFYQPGYFFLTLALNAIVPDALTATQLAVLVMFIAGGIGMLLLVREFCDTFSSWAAAAWFLLTPYLFVNLHVRGDLSELLSIVLTPWPLLFLSRLYRAVRQDAATWPWLGLTALALAGIVLAHPFTALFYYPTFCVIALAWTWGEHGRAQPIRGAQQHRQANGGGGKQ